MAQTRLHNISLALFALASVTTIGIICYILIRDWIWAQNQIKKANEKCQEYNEQVCKLSIESTSTTSTSTSTSTPRSNTRIAITDGGNVTEWQIAHQALIQFENPTLSRSYSCEGSLISEHYVLTSAYCIITAGHNPLMRVTLGNMHSELSQRREYKVTAFHVHPGYTNQVGIHGLLDDIALLKLDKKVDFDRTMRPICLNTDYKIEKYRNIVIASGWDHNNTEVRLKMTQLRIDEDPKSTCGKHLNMFGGYSEYIICTLNPGENKSGTNGGGPLQVWTAGCSDGKTPLYELIGVSINKEKDFNTENDFFDIFTKVDHYVPWIASIVWP